MDHQDFLVELGTEELPPKALSALSVAFTDSIIRQVEAAGLSFSEEKTFATPRRLGLLLSGLSMAQSDKFVERKGPAVQAAFKDGQATPAAKGFAKSCGVEVESLETLETDKGAWLVYRSTQPGKATKELLPGMVNTALNDLPIPKRMRWGARRDEFVRPAHWLVMLFGDAVVEGKVLGLLAGRETFGHRIHSTGPLTIESPAQYEALLEHTGKVIADFDRRKQMVKVQVEAAACAVNGKAVIEAALLNEVTGLVEWPVAIAGVFDQSFLQVPNEALISSMQAHQKYFPVIDKDNNLLPNFICIANLESKDMSQVIAGNERVIRPRLADAQFFYETDLKTTLEAKREKLKSIVFQKQLGSVFDKTERVARLAQYIVCNFGLDEGKIIGCEHNKRVAQVNQAAILSKSDLVSEMVLEFPELQGTMGRYYAQAEQLDAEVCIALEEQYYPRFSGGKLPSTEVGCAVAIADKLDTLVGIFGIKQPPSGNKDPFALRRAMLGILRIIITKFLPLRADDLIKWAHQGFQEQGINLAETKLEEKVTEFMFDRLRSLNQDPSLHRAKIISVETFLAVRAVSPMSPLDFSLRMEAVQYFVESQTSKALFQVNKRVANILEKAGDMNLPDEVNVLLLKENAEQMLFQALSEQKKLLNDLGVSQGVGTYDYYRKLLNSLAALKQPVDNFFDQVLVNADDLAIRANRYALLKQLRELFLKVADISLIS